MSSFDTFSADGMMWMTNFLFCQCRFSNVSSDTGAMEVIEDTQWYVSNKSEGVVVCEVGIPCTESRLLTR